MEFNPYRSPNDVSANNDRDNSAIDSSRGGQPLMLAASILGGSIALAVLPFLVALLLLIASNFVVFVVQSFLRKSTGAGLAILTCVLLLGTTIDTDWGFSSEDPKVMVSWSWLGVALLGQAGVIITVFSTEPRSRF